MEKKFTIHPVHLPFNCPFCNADLNVGAGTDFRLCRHVQFIRMKGDAFDYFVYVDSIFGHRYIDGLKASDNYRNYTVETNSPRIDEQIEHDFITGEYLSVSEIASAVPYFEDVAVDAACADSAVFIEKRPYGNVVVCLGNEPANIPGTSLSD